MTWAIFRKQTFRNLKNNWSIIALVFAFVIIGVSLVAGVVSYLFNAYHFTIERAFQNGSHDAKIIKNVLRWNLDSESQPQDLTFANEQEKTFFRNNSGLENYELNENQKIEIYEYVLKHEGYAQSLLFDQDRPNFDDQIKIIIESWLNNELKQFNGNVFARYLYFLAPLIDSQWDTRTTNILDNGVTTFLNKEIDVNVTVYQDDWIKDPTIISSPPHSPPSLFQEGDFTYNLMVSYAEYRDLLNQDSPFKPLFVTPKTLKNFNLRAGQELILVNKLMPIDHRLDKYKIVGTAVDSSNMIVFSEQIAAFMPFSHFWDKIQTRENYKKIEFYISTNQRTNKGFPSRFRSVENKIRDAKIFRGRDGINDETATIIDSKPPSTYFGYYTFWITNISIVTLVIVATTFLIFFVILFTTNQLIENNKQTLQFLKCLGLNNSELSLLNMANILVPILGGLLIGVIGSFVIQNLISFLLETQYPFVLNYWMMSAWMVLIYLGICLFVLMIFFVTNFIVLSRHNILQPRESSLSKHVISGRFRNWTYNKVTTNTKISLAINGSNLRKSIITTVVLTVTFSVILFGIGFKESINYQGRSAMKFYHPYKNYSLNEAPLFSTPRTWNAQSDEQATGDWQLSQTPILETNIKQELQEILSYQDVAKMLTEGSYNWFITSITIDDWLAKFSSEPGENPFEKALKDFEEWLKAKDIQPGLISEILRSASLLYDNYQGLKLQLLSLYDYTGMIRFFTGRNVIPNAGDVQFARTMSLGVNINQRVKGNTPPNDIEGIGLIDQSIQRKLNLDVANTRYLEVKISQKLANKLSITKTELAFNNPVFDLSIPLNRNASQSIRVRARVKEILKAEFLDNRIFYGMNNLQALLKNNSITPNSDNPTFLEQWQYFKQKILTSPKEFANGLFTDFKIPNALLNVVLPLNFNQGQSIQDFANGSDVTSMIISDYKITAAMIADSTASYIHLINNITYIFIVLTIVVSLLLTYLFLIKNRQNILLFKSLGYSTLHISNFMIWGYLLAAFIGVALAIGISVLVVSLLGTVFNDLFNITITFTFTWRYSLLVVFLPIIFITLILVSLWIYTYRQDPKQVLSYG